MRKTPHRSLFKRCVAIVIMCLLLLSFGACEKKTADVIRLNEVTHSVFYAPLYVAMEKGFFKEENITIELTNGGGADKVMTAILSGQADIGLAGPEASIYVYNEEKDDYPKVFGQLTKRDGSFLMGRKAEPDFKWSNLKGKSIIGGRPGGIPLMTLEYTLREHGLTPGKDVEVITNIQFNLMAGAFTSGTGDYVTIFEPTASDLMTQEKAYIVASVGEVSGEVPYTAFQATQSYLKNNSALVERFMKAIQKAQNWVHSNTPEEVAKAMLPQFPDTSVELLAQVAKRYQEIDAWMKDGVMTKDAFDRLQTIMEQSGELKTRVPYEALIDNSFAEKVKK